MEVESDEVASTEKNEVFQEDQTLTTLGGGELTVMEIESQMKIDSANLVFIDREADNGYVHIIDRVLMPN